MPFHHLHHIILFICFKALITFTIKDFILSKATRQWRQRSCCFMDSFSCAGWREKAWNGGFLVFICFLAPSRGCYKQVLINHRTDQKQSSWILHNCGGGSFPEHLQSILLFLCLCSQESQKSRIPGRKKTFLPSGMAWSSLLMQPLWPIAFSVVFVLF